MPSIEISAARPIRPVETPVVETPAVRAAPSQPEVPAKVEATKPGVPHSAVVRSDAFDPGSPPVDADRVTMIRKAVENGKYPVVPAKIADAIIAAGFLLRTPQ